MEVTKWLKPSDILRAGAAIIGRRSSCTKRMAPEKILGRREAAEAAACTDVNYFACTNASGRLISISTNAIRCSEPFITSCSMPAGR